MVRSTKIGNASPSGRGRRDSPRADAPREGHRVSPTLRPSPCPLPKGEGFTLLELMIVVTVIAILASIAIPMYRAVVANAKETVLLDNLREIRRVIDQYTADKKKAPTSLQDLVDAGYFRQLPVDPMTNSNSTWQPVNDTSIAAPDQTDSGIVDVHSGSTAVSSKGTPFNTW
jgi:general secretion pathway protein G